jgi:NDP-sugar pyrophosphorylase family protein
VALHFGKIYHDNLRYELKGSDGNFHVFIGAEELVGASLLLPGSFLGDDLIEIDQGVLVESGVSIYGPTILGAYSTVRQGAYIRGSVFTGNGVLIGHATESKNVLMLDQSKAGHFAYLGDSIIGQDVNLGAGTKLANLKMSNLPFRFSVDGETIEVSRRKFGAILGDGVETGCNSVINPGTLMGQNSKIRPNVSVKPGYHEPLSVIK